CLLSPPSWVSQSMSLDTSTEGERTGRLSRRSQVFIFGDIFTKSHKSSAAVQGFLETAKELLRAHYHPCPTDAAETDIEGAEGAMQGLVERCCGPLDPSVQDETYEERHTSFKGEALLRMHIPEGTDLDAKGVVLVGQCE
ncbi:hypothetical protein KIPB_011483, partial [Kipferlia bialata]